MKVIILRGIPGSGKSRLARQLACETGAIHSTDDYFTANGRYRRVASELREAHSWNLYLFKISLERRIPVVICDNTNVKHRDYETYVHWAGKFGYEVEIITMPHPDPEVAASRNIHKVPLEDILRMLRDWED